MKKILLFLLLIFCIPFSIFAINGDGSFASPYNGPITSDMTWSSTVYVNGDVTVNGFTLTINQGTTILFVAGGSDLIITGTGVLTASGSAPSLIRFTADFNNNGIYGETGERWGHISFQNMTTGFTTPSIINYCIIEFGQKNQYPYDDESRGGGINTTFSNLTISNSIIRNNYAGGGGGICVSSGASILISNCILANNTAGTTGGGLILDHSPQTRINNCIIMKNTSSGDGGAGGVFIGTGSTGVTINNSTIVSNISSLNRGNNIRFFQNGTLPRTKFYNTIVWGSNGSIDYYGQALAAADFNFCAIQGYTSGYTNCINLNGTNNDPFGPNFYNIAAGSEDYQINYISPCRDAGTTPSPTIPGDFIGNSRIGPYDIGAYEVQYSRWKTTAASTEWGTSENWEGGIPTNSREVIIPTGATAYPTAYPGPDFTIGSGKQMILNPGAQVTLNTLTNNGSLKLESDASNISSLITGTYSGNPATVELYLTGGGSKGSYKWHYISIPTTTNVSASIFTAVTFDLVGYNEPRVSTNVSQGWIGFDGWIYTSESPAYDYNYDFTNLTPGKGYEFWDNNNNKFTFSGPLNTSDVSPAVTFKSGGISGVNGFNLLGNPFSSGLDWDYIITHNFPDNTSKSLYFTRDNVWRTYINGVGVPSDVNGYIPPMQGFFTKTYVENHIIPLVAAARTHTIHPRYKGKSEIPLVRLYLAEDTLNDETVVRFDNMAKQTLDNDFDAVKMSVSPENLLIYSSADGINYVINGQPFPDSIVNIPIVVNLKKDGIHTISTTELQGLDNYNVFLIDNTSGFTANLKTTPVVTFSASAEKITDRFILKVSNVLTGTEDPIASKYIFNIYPSNNMINIQTLADEWNGKQGSVKVLDLSGKTIADVPHTEFSKNSVTQVDAPPSKGLYVVELRSGAKRYVSKVVIK